MVYCALVHLMHKEELESEEKINLEDTRAQPLKTENRLLQLTSIIKVEGY
jgi:hypothetical protein